MRKAASVARVIGSRRHGGLWAPGCLRWVVCTGLVADSRVMGKNILDLLIIWIHGQVERGGLV
jgi:hypothetical protein